MKKEITSCAEGGWPFDRRHRQGGGAGQIHRVAGVAPNRLAQGPLFAAPRRRSHQRRRRREAVVERDRRLRDFVGDRLAEGWTPEQIAGWLKAGHERGLRTLGFEAIYAFVYRAARKGEELWRYLTRRHKRRRARPSRD